METRKYNKIICIGMHKTGTTTLGLALIELGYNVLGARTDVAELLLNEHTNKVLKITEPFDALQDVPWALLYKELDKKYPGSKFILTTRDEKKWLHSVLNHFRDTYIPLHEWIYGVRTAKGNEDVYLSRYKQHYTEVYQYFKNREDDLLILSLTDGDGWEKLCNFLDLPVPKKKFPHSNKGRHNMNLIEKGYNYMRALIPTSLRRRILDVFCFPDKRNRFNNHYENKAYRNRLKDQ
jgi:hypothetical protein